MMKKCVALFLALMMVLRLTTAVAESDADALDYDELMDWAAGLQGRGRWPPGAPLNDPTEEAAYTEDGYAFVYDFATLYMDRPEMTAGQRAAGGRGLFAGGVRARGARGVDQLSSEVAERILLMKTTICRATAASRRCIVSDTMPAGAHVGLGAAGRAKDRDDPVCRA